MRFNIRNTRFILATLFLSFLLTSSCTLFNDDTVVTRAPPNEDLITQRERERRERLGDPDDESFIGNVFNDITGLGDNKDSNSGGGGIGVNSLLWRATLDTLSFMPLVSADPFGGVIITDWYADSEIAKERFKIVAYIIGTELRVDGIKVSVFKKTKDKNGDWVDKKSSTILQNKIEDVILTKARKYKIQNTK
ncbi:DUF3576 domain-containing protein [Alphaproteobacteria bacterium]|nr:DUF3576 domain-containing protein [Alphaproteobacteria bacterium]